MNGERTQPDDSSLSAVVAAIDPGMRLIQHWPLTGGVSAQTTALEVERGNGTRQRLVVRQHGPRDVARDPEIARHEYQLLQALHASGLPVPRPVQIFEAGEIFEGPAVTVEFLDGEIVTKSESPSRYAAVIAYWLARIHDFDLTSTDLGFLVANDYQAAHRFQPRPEDSSLVQAMCETLRNHGPVEFHNQPVLLHGDFWEGNLLWREESIVGILDWEDAAIGDPILDLAGTRLELLTHGELAREHFTSVYLSYRDINVDTLAYWDLALAIGLARAAPGWALSREREREVLDGLVGFVQQAKERLRANWG